MFPDGLGKCEGAKANTDWLFGIKLTILFRGKDKVLIAQMPKSRTV